ncbi:MAG TPA: hypothetical protein PLG97_03945 [Alcaligenes sp.]|nr:hypothetical protein [Alcaligenes sp.]HRL26648.1 hypothetical protein [Alcaligenes sp.]
MPHATTTTTNNNNNNNNNNKAEHHNGKVQPTHPIRQPPINKPTNKINAIPY